MRRTLALVDRSDDSTKYEPVSATSASGPLLETKLYVPSTHSALVPRPRLSNRLCLQDSQKLTLVAAPAGFGKTTLLAARITEAGFGGRAAWVSLDPSENEPRLFWAYVITALQRTNGVLGANAFALLHSSRQPDIDAVVATLINEITAADTDFVLVLDDYHVIDEPSIHASVTFLLDRLPPRMHVMIASRSEPPLGLPRLRARGELTELRPDDLRFTLDEASVFLNQVMALGLSPCDLGTLEQRTEGWIAGLKLAALSIKGRNNAHAFVEAFSGENRHIADYLVDEVLRSEPDHVRRFLLATSILDRLSGPLCDEVLGETGSQALLEDLERRNLFVVALDDHRHAFRYHHLFAEVLQKQSATSLEDVRLFHGRASAWYEAHGAPADAVRHALDSGDSERAANLLERTWPEKDRSYESAKWLARVKTLPESVVSSRPVLNMGFAWALLNGGELEAAELRLNEVERSLREAPEYVDPHDPQRLQSLETELASARIYLNQSRGDIPGTLEHATRTLASIPASDHAARATGIALVALAHWGRGELESAHRTFSDALVVMRTTGHELDAIRGTFVLGDLRVSQGRLRDAATIYRHGLELVDQSPSLASAETDELHLGLSELRREWNDIAVATMHLDTIRQREQSIAHKGNRQRWYIAMARIREALGDRDDALALLSEAEKHERRDPLPRLRPIGAMKTRIHIAQGILESAASWARTANVRISDDLSFLREFEHVTLARLLIARRGAPATDVVLLLDRLRIAAQTGGRIGSVVEILILQSLAQHASGNARAALESLAEALTLAEPEGYLRIFLDEGAPMRELLRTATARGLAGPYTRRVLAAFDQRPQPAVALPVVAANAESMQALTTRELEILRLIAAGLRNQEIAEHLAISAATVKRHIANAYGKLGVSHRTEALVRAAELKLL